MQSFRWSIRFLQRGNFTGSNIALSESSRACFATSESSNRSGKFDSSSLVPNQATGSKSIHDMVGFSRNYLTHSIAKLASSSPGAHKQFGPNIEKISFSNIYSGISITPFSTRGFASIGDSIQSASQDSSGSVSNVPPRIKFKRLDKTSKHIMQILDKEAVEEVRTHREIPEIKPGYIVQLKVEVPENKRRVSIVKGIVIARRNAGLNTTFRIRRLVAGVGVESLFPLYSPNLKEIKVLDKKKVRRAKLYYLRDKMNALKNQ